MNFSKIKENALKYLGYHHQTLDEKLNNLIDECIEEIEKMSSFRATYRKFPLSFHPLRIDEISLNLNYPELNDLFQNCHELIIIGNINDETESSVVQNNSTYSSNGNNSDKGSTLININTADLEQLKGITGIGNIKAQSIIDYREANGGFKSLEELKNVDGIGDKTFEKIKEQITL